MTTTASPEFLQFVNYMQCTLCEGNSQILTNLYVNYNTYQPPIPCGSSAEKFIFWKQLYDQYALEQEKIANANLFNNPNKPSDPRLKVVKTELPDDLTTLCVKSEDTQLFQTFNLQNEIHTSPPPPYNAHHIQTESATPHNSPVKEENMSNEITTTNNIQDVETVVEVLNESPIQTSDEEQEKTPTLPNYKRSPSRGKNIEQLKAIHAENENKVKEKPTAPPRKRKRPAAASTRETSGPGRPTKDIAIIRDAKIADSDSDDGLAFREVALFSGTGQIRKKTRLLTKHGKDIKCFAIKHYLPLEHLAEQKTKAFAKIKQQRQKLKIYNYIEQNLLESLNEIQNL
ncbi:Hypothetical predicted protein [Paramuricea clavata]|uniref:Uncharacterized protein n=1 Tax=Paramuricea clavata TaxID=317549 RepID=A0A7D9D775_PARCT|nr:Hypothetical predicted protein [Paramuricea clavata]